MIAITESVGDVIIVRLSGKLELGNVRLLRDMFSELRNLRHNKILLDLEDTKKIDNACIHELEAIQERLQSLGGQLKLLSVEGVSGFTLATLMSFDVYDDEILAITNFK